MTVLPPVERIAPGTWSIPLPLPIRFVRYTLCYLLLDAEGGAHLVDPGWDSEEGRDALRAGLNVAGIGMDDVRSSIVTHLHPDHLGLAIRLNAESRVPIVLTRQENAAMGAGPYLTREEIDSWGVPADRLPELLSVGLEREQRPTVEADILVADGDRLDLPGRDIEVLHTPGHTLGHQVLADHGERLIFTGDHVLPGINPGLGLGGRGPSNPISDYLTALDRVARYDGYEVCPGHEHRFSTLAARCTEIGDHHRRRTAEVATAIAADPDASVWELAQHVHWTAGWDALAGTTLLSALGQIAMHRALLADASGAAPA